MNIISNPSSSQFYNTSFHDATPLMQNILEESKGHTEHNDPLSNYSSSLFILFSCPLRAYWDRVSPLKEDRDWRLTAAHGNAIHDFLSKILMMSGRCRGEEVRGSNARANLSYRIDNLIWDGLHTVPLEIKSARSYLYKKYITRPHRAHVLQLQSYLHFHKPNPHPYGYLLYYNKDLDEISLIRMDYNEELGAEIEDKLIQLEESISYRTPPQPTSDVDECKWCPYKMRCDRG